eukprot:s2331_g8.t1
MVAAPVQPAAAVPARIRVPAGHASAAFRWIARQPGMGRIQGRRKQIAAAPTALAFCMALTRRERKRVSRQCADSPTFDSKSLVYIEDTDCFGVVFYANYFRFFQRALNELHDLQGKKKRDRAVIVGVTQARYRNAAKLGDVLTVQLWLEEDAQHHQRWKVSSVTDVECVSAELLVVHPDQNFLSSRNWPAFAGQPRATLVPAREECASPPSMHDVLRWFERSRSDFLGGPKALQQVMDLGILVVVARIDDFEYDTKLVNLGKSDRAVDWEVRSVLDISRGKLIFDERLIMQPNSDDEVAIARAKITCVCIDATTRRITRAPKKLLELIK